MNSCTVVIPTHNREALLERAVRSALAACPASGEVLVIDDKSGIPASEVLSKVQDGRLRVIVNAGRSGAASARNLGVSLASGRVVFFLDDDDELLPDYCQRVLGPDGPSSRADWGFSSTVVRTGDDMPQDAMRIRKRLRRGLVHSTARVRDRVAAMSDGFWIKRELFQEVGGLDPEQTIDEDTDLCVRLLAKAGLAWYESEPGAMVYRGYVPAHAGAAQLTVATSARRGVDCYRRTHDKNASHFDAYSAMRWFLCTRYLRRAVKAGLTKDAAEFAGRQQPFLWSMLLQVFVLVKRMRPR